MAVNKGRKTPPRQRHDITGGLVVVSCALLLATCGMFDSDRMRVARASRHVIQTELQVAVQPPVPVGRSRLVVDWTKSMAGFAAPDGQPLSRFNRSLRELAARLPNHQLLSHGLRSAGLGASLENLLVPQPLGLGREFENPASYSGANNHDDLLFRALASEEDPRPLVLVTDAVFSPAEAAGVLPVVEALNALLDDGWVLGIFALTSEFYGIPCEILGSSYCAEAERWFHSESRAVKRGSQLIPFHCGRVERPFYVFVLSPSADLHYSLESVLKSGESGEVYSYLLAPAAKTHIGVSTVEFDPVPNYDMEGGWPWLMVESTKVTSPFVATVRPALAPSFPADLLDWVVELERHELKQNSGWQPWVSESSTVAQVVPPVAYSESSLARRAVDFEPLIGSRTCSEDLSRLYRSSSSFLARRANTGEELQWRALNSLCAQPRRLYCASLAASRRQIDVLSDSDRELAPFFILAAIDAFHRAQLEERTYYLELAASGSQAGLAPLVKQLRGLTGKSALSRAVEPASELTGDSSAIDVPDIAVEPTDVKISLNIGGIDLKSGLYRIRLVPRIRELRPEVYRLSTVDDSEPSQTHRTYRFAELIGALTAAHLERVAAEGSAPELYLTVYRP